MQRDTDDSYARLGSEVARRVSVRVLSEQFAGQPAQRQRETRERVIDLLRCERRRKQAQPSALWQLAPVVYGIDPAKV